MPFGKKPVAQHIAQRSCRLGPVHLGPRFLMATRRGEQNLRPGTNPGKKRVIRGSVARMQRHQDIQLRERVFRNGTAHKPQPAETAILCHAIAELRQVRAGFHAGDLRLHLLHALKIVVSRKRQVALYRSPCPP